MRHCPSPNDEPHHRNDHLFRGHRDQVTRADHSLMSIRAFRAAVFVVLLAACGLVSGVQAADTVADGDTRAVNQNRPLALEGPWAFHWRHWVAPGQAEGERPPPDARVSLPGSWTAVVLDADSPHRPRATPVTAKWSVWATRFPSVCYCGFPAFTPLIGSMPTAIWSPR